MDNLRLIRYSENDGFLNMAIDEALINLVSDEKSQATIRFYGWKPNCVSIGFFQSINDEVNLDMAKKLGVDIVRRYTGGGAVFHHDEITYSIILPERFVSSDIIESYSKICKGVIFGLNNLGLNASFKPINDIIVNNKKISGNAQTRKRGVLLQHGTILIDVDLNKMFSLLKVSKEKISDKDIDNARERVTWVKREIGKDIGLKDVENCLIEGFSKAMECDLVEGLLQPEEMDLALKFSKEKYCTNEWNFWR